MMHNFPWKVLSNGMSHGHITRTYVAILNILSDFWSFEVTATNVMINVKFSYPRAEVEITTCRPRNYKKLQVNNNNTSNAAQAPVSKLIFLYITHTRVYDDVQREKYKQVYIHVVPIR